VYSRSRNPWRAESCCTGNVRQRKKAERRRAACRPETPPPFVAARLFWAAAQRSRPRQRTGSQEWEEIMMGRKAAPYHTSVCRGHKDRGTCHQRAEGEGGSVSRRRTTRKVDRQVGEENRPPCPTENERTHKRGRCRGCVGEAIEVEFHSRQPRQPLLPPLPAVSAGSTTRAWQPQPARCSAQRPVCRCAPLFACRTVVRSAPYPPASACLFPPHARALCLRKVHASKLTRGW